MFATAQKEEPWVEDDHVSQNRKNPSTPNRFIFLTI